MNCLVSDFFFSWKAATTDEMNLIFSKKIHNGFPVKSEKNEKINFVLYYLEKKGDRKGHQKVGENYPWGHFHFFFHFFILSSRLKFVLIKIRKLKRLLGFYCSTAFSTLQRLKKVKGDISSIIEHLNKEKLV